MTLDRQADRWVRARVRHHEAAMAHRYAQRELDAATSEPTTAGAALAERARPTDTRPRPAATLPGRWAA